MRYLLLILTAFLSMTSVLFGEEKKIDIFPPSPYDQSAIYLNLILFWMALVGLVIVFALKLKEIERVQKLDKEDKQGKIPLLD